MLLLEVKNEILRLARIIKAPQDILPRFEKLTYDGLYVDSDDQLNLYFIEQERGRIYNVKSTQDVQEFLFWIFDDITYTMALSYAREHNTPPRDSRRISIVKHEELLKLINSQWALEVSERHKKYLEGHPFEDNYMS